MSISLFVITIKKSTDSKTKYIFDVFLFCYSGYFVNIIKNKLKIYSYDLTTYIGKEL